MYKTCKFLCSFLGFMMHTKNQKSTMWSPCSSLNTDSFFILQQVSWSLSLSRVRFLLTWQMCYLTIFQAQLFSACPIGTFRCLVWSDGVKQTALKGLFARDQKWTPLTIVFYKNCLCYIACSWEKKWNNTVKCQSCQDLQSQFIITEILETCM